MHPGTATNAKNVVRRGTAQPSAESSALTAANGGTKRQFANNLGKPRMLVKEVREGVSAPSVTGVVTPGRSVSGIPMAPAIVP